MSKQRLEEYMGDGKIISKVVDVIPNEVQDNVATVSVIETETVAEVITTTPSIEVPVIADEILNISEESPVSEDVIKDEIPEPPQISTELQEERKQEFLGLREEEKTEKKNDENENSEGENKKE